MPVKSYRVKYNKRFDGEYRDLVLSIFANSKQKAMGTVAQSEGTRNVEFVSCEPEEMKVKSLASRKVAVPPSLKLRDVEGQNLIILAYRLGDSDYGEYALMTVTLPDGSEATLLTSASVVLRTVREMTDEDFPVTARFVRPDGKVWDILPPTKEPASTTIKEPAAKKSAKKPVAKKPAMKVDDPDPIPF